MIQEAIKLFLLNIFSWFKTTLLIISIGLNIYFINDARWIDKFNDVDIEELVIEKSVKIIENNKD